MSILKTNDFWRSGENYIATSRYKSMVLYQNKFYICTVTHESGGTFEENANKFILVSGGGGSGSLIPQGEWDINNSTTLGPDELQQIRLINSFDASFTNNGNILNISSNNPLTLYPLGSGGVFTFFASSSNQVQNNFSTTRYITIPANADTRSYDIVQLYDDPNSNIIPNDVFNVFAGGGSSTLTTTKSLLLGCLNFDGTRQIAVSYCDGVNPLNILVNGLPVPASTSITIGINTTLNELYIMNGLSILQTVSIPSNLFDTNTLTFSIGGAAGSFLGSNGLTSVESPSVNYIQESRQSNIVIPPLGATDGSLWKVVSDGAYNDISVKNGDYVIFYDGLSEIILLPNLTSELNNIDNQLDYISTQINGNLLDLYKQVLLNGVIDDCGDAPTSTLTGSVFLAYNNPPVGMQPYRLHVYSNGQWNLVDVPNGTEFTLANTGVKIRYKTVSYTGTKSQLQTYNINSSILNRLGQIINDGNNYNWEIVLDSHYKDNCYMHVGNSGEAVLFDANLYDSLHLYLDDSNSDTYYNITLDLQNDSDNVLRKVIPYRICIENKKSYDVNLLLNDGTSGQLKPIYPLSSTKITIPRDSILNLHYRPILNDSSSMYKLIEYVSGSYKKMYYFIDSNLSENVNNPSKVVVNYTTGDTFTFTVENLFITNGMCIDVVLKNNMGVPVQFIFSNGGVSINQSSQLGIYTLVYDSGSWGVI